MTSGDGTAPLTRTCKNPACGKEFTPARNWRGEAVQVYCTVPCRRAGERAPVQALQRGVHPALVQAAVLLRRPPESPLDTEKPRLPLRQAEEAPSAVAASALPQVRRRREARRPPRLLSTAPRMRLAR